MKEDILEIKNLSIRKRNKKDSLVDSVNISVKKGEVVALVGESGAGKSITSLSILKLLYQGLGLEVNGEICLTLNNDLINLSQSDKEQIRQIKKICCFFKPCSMTKIFCAPIARIKLNPVKKPNNKNSTMIYYYLIAEM